MREQSMMTDDVCDSFPYNIHRRVFAAAIFGLDIYSVDEFLEPKGHYFVGLRKHEPHH